MISSPHSCFNISVLWPRQSVPAIPEKSVLNCREPDLGGSLGTPQGLLPLNWLSEGTDPLQAQVLKWVLHSNPWDRLGWIIFPCWSTAGLGMGALLGFIWNSCLPQRSQNSPLAAFSLPWQWFQSRWRPWSVDCVWHRHWQAFRDLPKGLLMRLLICVTPLSHQSTSGTAERVALKSFWLYLWSVCVVMGSLRLEKLSRIEFRLCLIPSLSPAQSTECHIQEFLGHLQGWEHQTSLGSSFQFFFNTLPWYDVTAQRMWHPHRNIFLLWNPFLSQNEAWKFL